MRLSYRGWVTNLLTGNSFERRCTGKINRYFAAPIALFLFIIIIIICLFVFPPTIYCCSVLNGLREFNITAAEGGATKEKCSTVGVHFSLFTAPIQRFRSSRSLVGNL